MRERFLKKTKVFINCTLQVLCCFIGPVISLFSIIIPKKANLVVFIGKKDNVSFFIDKEQFVDNVKYLYAYVDSLQSKDVEYYYLLADRKLYKELKGRGFPVLLYPGLKAVIKLIRANVVIADCAHWVYKFRYHLSFKSKKVQLWHGVGFKTIRLTSSKFTKRRLRFFQRNIDNLIGEHPYYDLFNSTSEFYTQNVFKPSFFFKDYIEAGYPRNDVLFDGFQSGIIEINTDKAIIEKIKNYKEKGYKLVLYAPTFRTLADIKLNGNAFDLERLSRFGVKNNIVFVFKMHPIPSYKDQKNEYENILHYNNTCDVYPVFKDIDLMITDYSSIYMDYLLLDRPVLFYTFDYQEYVNNSKKIQFDYDWITPGSKCKTQDELEQAIYEHLVENKDDYKTKRAEIRDMAFKYKDGKASERIWEYIKDNFIKKA